MIFGVCLEFFGDHFQRHQNEGEGNLGPPYDIEQIAHLFPRLSSNQRHQLHERVSPLEVKEAIFQSGGH